MNALLYIIWQLKQCEHIAGARPPTAGAAAGAGARHALLGHGRDPAARRPRRRRRRRGARPRVRHTPAVPQAALAHYQA